MSNWKPEPGEDLITIPVTFTRDMLCLLHWLSEAHGINFNDEVLLRLGESFDEEDLEKNPHLVWVQ